MKKILCLANAKLVDIRGGHGVRINIHACQSNLEMSIYIVKSASRANIWSQSVSNRGHRELDVHNLINLHDLINPQD